MRIAAGALLLFQSTLSSAVPFPRVVSNNHSRWDSAYGFPGGHIYSITQTSDGYLWIGTSNGLIRFDGLSFTAIHQNLSEVGGNTSIVGLAADVGGQLWATNGLQLFHYLNGQLQTGLPGRGPEADQDIVISKARDGGLLFAAGREGIFIYDRGSSQLLVEPRELSGTPISMVEGTDRTFWIGTHTGLFAAERKDGHLAVQRTKNFPDTKVNSLMLLERGMLLIGTDKGLWIWDGSKANQVNVPSQLRNLRIFALALDLDGKVWAGTETGLFKADLHYENARPDLRNVTQLAGDSPVTALYEDREGSMWLGGLEGLERYRENAFLTYVFSRRGAPENSGPVYVDEQDRTWFAPPEGGLSWFGQGLTGSVESDGLNTDGVYSIAGGNGEVWVGRKRGGLTRVRLSGKATETRTYTKRNGLVQDSVYSVYRSPDGTVWAGTLSEGVSRIRRGVVKSFTTENGLPSNTVSVITGTEQDGIFVGTPNGLGELRDDHWTTYTVRDGLPPGAINCLLADRTGTLWIGTAKGLAFLRSGIIQVPTKVPDSLSEEILGMAQTEGGWLWISTSSRVLRVRKDALVNGVKDDSDYREYGVADGLASVEGVKRTRSVVEDDRGRVWFSLNGGISVVQPSILARQSTPAAIHLEQMVFDGKPVSSGISARIATGPHRLTFHFACVSLTNPDQVRYRYRLDGYDSNWSEPVSIREANYTSLPPGDFRFRVVARGAEGLWSGREATMGFVVEPAYWQSPWFQSELLVAISLLVWGLYRLRLFQLTRRLNLKFDERLAERARISRDLHDTLLQNLTGLTLQISGMAKIVTEPPRAAEGLQQLKRQAEDCVRETRQSVWDIRSADVEIQDLPGALKHSGQQLTNGKAIRFTFACEGEARELPAGVRQHLLRIAREAIGNAVRHADAKEIRLMLKFSFRDLELLVSDDGLGFDLASKKKLTGHFGLSTMNERAQQIGASMQVTSAVGQGTSISVRVPRKAQ